GVSANNMQLWLKADAGVTTSGSNVSQWTNQASTAMTTQASKTASSNVVLNSNTFNYNPTVTFDGTSGQNLAGQFTTASANPALIFAVVKKSSTTDNDNGNPFSLGPAGASGINNQGSFGHSLAIDYAGGACAKSADVRGIPGIARSDY